VHAVQVLPKDQVNCVEAEDDDSGVGLVVNHAVLEREQIAEHQDAVRTRKVLRGDVLPPRKLLRADVRELVMRVAGLVITVLVAMCAIAFSAGTGNRTAEGLVFVLLVAVLAGKLFQVDFRQLFREFVGRT